MNDIDRKLLTEYLGECWHSDNSNIYHPCTCLCGKECNEAEETLDRHCARWNRTFTIRADMMDLYQKIAEKGEWEKLYGYAKIVFIREGGSTYGDDLAIWLFCLLGTGYEERRQMVADWVKGGERGHYVTT